MLVQKFTCLLVEHTQLYNQQITVQNKILKMILWTSERTLNSHYKDFE